METFSALLAVCVGNLPVTCEFPSQRPVKRSFDIYYDLHLNERLSKQLWGWWFETLCSLWRHCNLPSDFWEMFILRYCGIQHRSWLSTNWNIIGHSFLSHKNTANYFGLYTFNHCSAEVVSINMKNIFAFAMISVHSDGTISWNPASWNARTHLFHMFNTMAPDVLMMQRVLTQLSLYIPVWAPKMWIINTVNSLRPSDAYMRR